MTKLNNSNCDKTQKLKLWQNSKKSKFLVKTTWHLQNRWDFSGQLFAISRCFLLKHCLIEKILESNTSCVKAAQMAGRHYSGVNDPPPAYTPPNSDWWVGEQTVTLYTMQGSMYPIRSTLHTTEGTLYKIQVSPLNLGFFVPKIHKTHPKIHWTQSMFF